MPQDDQDEAEKSNRTRQLKSDTTHPRRESPRSWFTVPTPVKRVFDRFPLVSYAANDLPLRALRSSDKHVLCIFTREEDTLDGKPSFNPGCLKWQTYLRLCEIDFETKPSNNHASPTGSLPFLLPARSTSGAPESSDVIASNRLHTWAAKHGKGQEESADVRYEAFTALLDHTIRRAWLYSVYLTVNFESIVVPRYIHRATSSPFIRLASAYDLQTAAAKELRKHSSTLDATTIYNDAHDAFHALEDLLGQDEWFFGKQEACLFDAAVFAYTYLLQEEPEDRLWADDKLRSLLVECPGLVRHQQRIYEQYYSS